MDVTNEGSGRGSLFASQHGHLSLSNLLDPFGRPKESIRCWDDKGGVIPVILNILFRQHVEDAFVVINSILESKDAAIEAILLGLLLFLSLLDGSSQPPSDVCGKNVVQMLNKPESCKGGARREGTRDPVGIAKHICHNRWFRDREW